MPVHPDAFIHPRALVDEPCDIGARTRVWANAHVLKSARIGEDCNICDGCFVEGGVVIGNGCTIKNGVSIWTGVTLADHVFLGPNAVLTNDMWPRSHPDFRTSADDWRPTRIEEGVSVGANATIICGATLGAWSFIAAGSVVTRSVPAHAMMVGAPARQVTWICRCCAPLGTVEDDGGRTCPKCSRRYVRTADGTGLQLV